MAASKDDLFMEVGGPGSATTLSAPGYTAGSSTSITVGSTSNWSSATGVIFAIDEAEVVNGVEVQKAGTYNEYSGTVTSGTLVSDVEWQMGVGDRSYVPGALTRVYIPVSAERENRLAQGMAVAHNQDGTLKDNVVTTAKLLDKAATLAKINGGTTAGVLATDASGNVAPLPAPGYAQITANFSTSNSTETAVPGLAATVDVPASARGVKITVSGTEFLALNSGSYAIVTIHDGAVGSGTVIAKTVMRSAVAAQSTPLSCVAYKTGVSGSKTYRVGLSASGGGAAQISAWTTGPAFILAEII